MRNNQVTLNRTRSNLQEKQSDSPAAPQNEGATSAKRRGVPWWRPLNSCRSNVLRCKGNSKKRRRAALILPGNDVWVLCFCLWELARELWSSGRGHVLLRLAYLAWRTHARDVYAANDVKRCTGRQTSSGCAQKRPPHLAGQSVPGDGARPCIARVQQVASIRDDSYSGPRKEAICDGQHAR